MSDPHVISATPPYPAMPPAFNPYVSPEPTKRGRGGERIMGPDRPSQRSMGDDEFLVDL
jgi:hypothetical protein